MPSRSIERAARGGSPKLPRFSPSRLSLYLFCPRAYHFYYARGLRWGRLEPGQAFGTQLHRALQLLHDRGGPEQVPLDQLLADLRDRWSPAGFGSVEEAEAHLAAGEELLVRYHRAGSEAGRTTLLTEKVVQHLYPDFILFGKVDRLDRRPDGSLEVVDYKSGRLSVTEEEVRASLALQVYQLVLSRQYPGTPVHATIHCLRTAVTATVVRAPEELDVVEREIIALVTTILEDVRMAALPGEQCRECVYPRLCPPGRAWLRERGE